MKPGILLIAGLAFLNATACRSNARGPQNERAKDVSQAPAVEVAAQGLPQQSAQDTRLPTAQDFSAGQGEASPQAKPPTADELLREVNEWRFQASPEERARIGEALVQLAGRSDAPEWGGLVELARWSMHGEPGRYLLLGDRPGAKGDRDMDGTPHGMAWYAIEFMPDTIVISDHWDVGVCILCFGVAAHEEDLDGDGKADLVFCTWAIPSEDEKAEVPPAKPIAIGWQKGAWVDLEAPPDACKDFVPTAP